MCDDEWHDQPKAARVVSRCPSCGLGENGQSVPPDKAWAETEKLTHRDAPPTWAALVTMLVTVGMICATVSFVAWRLTS